MRGFVASIVRTLLYPAFVAVLLFLTFASQAAAQTAPTTSQAPPGAQGAAPASQKPPARELVSCGSKPGERNVCAASTMGGVALVSSSGEAPCLLGRTWGYDDNGVWVSDGCTGEFYTGPMTKKQEKARPLQYVPN